MNVHIAPSALVAELGAEVVDVTSDDATPA